VITCSAVSTTLAKNLSLVSLTPVNNLYFPGYLSEKKPKSQNFITGVNDTAEILFSGVNDTADTFFSAVSATPAIRESCQY
jgi:hypothetical protein